MRTTCRPTSPSNVLLLWLFVAGSASADGRGALCLATPHLITWFAIAGGLAAWTAQLLGSYLLLDFGCAGVSGESGGLTAPLLAISAVCAAIALAATVAAGRRAAAIRALQIAKRAPRCQEVFHGSPRRRAGASSE